MPTIQIKDTEFYYELYGQGAPLVLVCGYGVDHLYWGPVLASLVQHFQVLIFDNRAIGRTKDQGTFPLTAESMADDTIALINALGLKKPHVIGQSMGGTIVQSIAARYPDQISKLGILNSSAKWRLATLYSIKSMLLIRQENASFDCWFETMIPWVFGEAFLQKPEQIEFLRTVIANNPYAPSVQDQERQYAVLERFDGRAALNKITAPTLVVYGAQDILSLPYESKALAEGIANAKLVEFDCAHGMITEVPEKLAPVLVDFFTN